MLTMRGRNSIWWPPTANCGIERLGLEATPTWPAVVLLAGYDPHYSVLQPGSVSRPGWGHPAITQLSNYGTIINGTAWRRAHQSTSEHINGTHSSRSQWTPVLTSHLLTTCSKRWSKTKGRPSPAMLKWCILPLCGFNSFLLISLKLERVMGDR